MNENTTQYLMGVTRILFAAMFLVTGIGKLMNPDTIIGMLDGLGFPAAAFFGWILILSEIIFGLALLVGWKLEYAVWPLVVVLVVATLTVYLPNFAADPMARVNTLLHLGAAAAIATFGFSGAGSWAIDKA